MSFTSRKPVTLEDIDDILVKVIDTSHVMAERLTVQREWLKRIDCGWRRLKQRFQRCRRAKTRWCRC